jgi:hypothetical protein
MFLPNAGVPAGLSDQPEVLLIDARQPRGRTHEGPKIGTRWESALAAIDPRRGANERFVPPWYPAFHWVVDGHAPSAGLATAF